MRRRYIPDGGWFENNEIFVLRLIALVIVVVIILVATGYADNLIASINPDLVSCKHGKCQDSCNIIDEIQKFDTQCVDSSKVCCIPKSKISSPECSKSNQGDSCGNHMVCDDTLKCVSKCEYCARFPESTSCIVSEGIIGRAVDVLSPEFQCGCSERECGELMASGLGTCVKGFCPPKDSVANNYMCCNRP